jgi:hypothetical protein
MMKLNRDKLIYGSGTLLFFVLYFIWFLLFDSYHLVYKEQTQLFRFGTSFFLSLLDRPGGISSYIGYFITQFYINPVSATITVTLQGILLFILSAVILKHYEISGLLWRLVPPVLLIPFAGNQLYSTGTTAALLIVLLFLVIYIKIKNDKYRYATGLVAGVFLYFLTGFFSIVAVLLCAFHELIFNRSAKRFAAVTAYILMVCVIPLLSSRLIFFLKSDSIWLSLLPLQLKKQIVPFFILLPGYFPLVILLSKPARSLLNRTRNFPGRTWIKVPAGLVLFGILSFSVLHFTYDIKSEILLQIDNSVQKGDWMKALDYSFSYPGRNQLVLYYGNMAMYKTGQMGDKMFHLQQAGIKGLWLDWKRNEITPFIGGELFYQLGYISEAHRWAFESMEALGENPRSLKRLVVTSIISGDTLVARHFLNSLNKTLFYRKWAVNYSRMLDNPGSRLKDKEIAEKIRLNLKTDIFADSKNNDIGLAQLLADHPDNRMAFEYFMASKLLNKDIDGFVSMIPRLRDLGYQRIPAHYEEAMIVYMNHTGKNIVPSGYTISRETMEKLSGFAGAISKYGNNRSSAAKMLFHDYGGTYWYYLSFTNTTN